MADEKYYPRTPGDEEAEAASAKYAAEHGLDAEVKEAEVKEIGGEGIEAALRMVEAPSEEERLRAPLTHEEHVKLLDSLQGVADAALLQGEKNTELSRQQLEDLRGDSFAVNRLRELLDGKAVLDPSFKPDATNPVAIEAVLHRVIDSLQDGQVQSEDGTLHAEGGFEGANLYQFVRARQLWEDINSADPRMIRQGALEAKEGADWISNTLLSEPVEPPRR